MSHRRRGLTVTELLVVLALLGVLTLGLFHVSRSFFRQYFQIENSLTLMSEAGIFFSRLGQDVLTATGDPAACQDLFRLQVSATDSWTLTFERYAEGKIATVTYSQKGNEIVRECQGQTQAFTFSGSVVLHRLEPELFDPSPGEIAPRVWLNVIMTVTTDSPGQLVPGKGIRFSRLFFPTFFNRRLNSSWIDNSRFTIGP
ncbi:MAG: prepilin-type N-terminal cleavage/methylation domain-containing protein [Candidatus Riflebacteria bacterium]|nr:prepilin-type N-terminal cleavage/methylation domain-containing protein [Candidatus Riflebacteria bacterium]